MLPESEEGQVPADAHGSRTELLPHVVADGGDVLELQTGASVGILGEVHLDPTGVFPVLPGQRQVTGRLTGGDLPAGISLQLVAAAQAQVARDRQEPAGNALDARQRVPQILDRRVVAPAGADDPRRAAG